MKYKGMLIVVKDCNRALKFYSNQSELYFEEPASDSLYIPNLVKGF